MKIQLSQPEDAQALADYYRDNSEHLRPWEPQRADGFHTQKAWHQRLEQRSKEQTDGTAAYLLAYCDTDTSTDIQITGEAKQNNRSAKLVACCSLTGITRGPFQACYMGYSIAKSHEGSGAMQALCRYAIAHAFEDLQLNRIMANYMPANHRSAKLLQNLGFKREGFAKGYLHINGRWEDHVLTALINPNNK